MEPMATWEKILIGVLALGLLLLFRPGLKEMMRRSREAENKDWGAVAIPLVLVVLFVMLLISMV